MEELTVHTSRKTHLVDVTAEVKAAVERWEDAVAAVVYVPHTTAGIIINEHADPAVASDVGASLERIVDGGWPFDHVEDMNAASHVRASLTASSVVIPMEGGRLALGTWQGVFLCEFDGPRRRSVFVAALR